MPERELHILRGNRQLVEQRRRCVAKIVDPDPTQAMLLADTVERAHEVTRFDRVAGARGEDQFASLASSRPLAGFLSGACLRIALREQNPSCHRSETQIPGTSLGFDLAYDQTAVSALKLLADVENARIEINIAPAQAEHFAAPQAVEQRQDKSWI